MEKCTEKAVLFSAQFLKQNYAKVSHAVVDISPSTVVLGIEGWRRPRAIESIHLKNCCFTCSSNENLPLK